MGNSILKILKKGKAIGPDNRAISVTIVKQNWDFFYEEGYDPEEPDLDKDGFAYYVIYGEYDDILYANRSKTCLSEAEAIYFAEETLQKQIIWNENM